MAMFDRRLLAYFDNSGLSLSRSTLQDRTVEYQHCLSEIEHELGKYQRLLGSQRVKLRARNRDGWIGAHRRDPSVRERCGHHLAERHDGVLSGRRESVRRESVGSPQPHGSHSSDHSADGRVMGKYSSNPASADALPAVAAPSTSARTAAAAPAAATSPVVEPSPALVPPADDLPAQAALATAAAAPAPAAPAAAAAPTAAPEVPLRAEEDGGCVMATTWAQLDTLTGLPPSGGGSAYVVCGGWEGHEVRATEERVASEAADGASEECLVRQQIYLAGGVGRWVFLEVLRTRLDGEELVGCLRLDALDEENHEIRTHALCSDPGEETGVSMRLRLHTPSAAGATAPRGTVSGAVSQDPRAAPRSTLSGAVSQDPRALEQPRAATRRGSSSPGAVHAGRPAAEVGEGAEQEEGGEEEDDDEEDESDEDEDEDEDEEEESEEGDEDEEGAESANSERDLQFESAT